MDYVPKLEQMLQRLFDNLGCDHDDEFDDQMEQALWKINQLKGVDDAAVRAMEAWGCTVLPVSNDGMMQDRMESLRAALVPNGDAGMNKPTKEAILAARKAASMGEVK